MTSNSIIGSGAIGSALAGHFAIKGIEVQLKRKKNANMFAGDLTKA